MRTTIMMATGRIASYILGFRNYSTKYAGNYGKWKNPSRRIARPRITWSDEQSRVISDVSSGKSVFISGSAGTGKTLLLGYLIKLLKKRHGRSNVYVTASTGIAACAINGQTLHSFAGLKCGAEDRESLLSGVVGDRRAMRRWKKACAVVSDEISMISGELLGNLEYIAREVRGIDKPWGGIQLVVAGDFFQLPPVFKMRDKGFAFEDECWNRSFNLQIELTKVFRQSDERLVRVLHGVRKGEIEDEDLKFLEQSCCESEPDSSVVRLFPRNNKVNAINQQRIEELDNHCYKFSAVDTGKKNWTKQLESMIAPSEISLCKQARVMLIKNINTYKGLVNGAVGTIVGFTDFTDECDVCPDGVMPIVKFDSGKEVVISPETWSIFDGAEVVAQRKQIPLLLAWALSIHKCQGMSLDRLHTDLSQAFEFGMVYVALSRIRNLDGLHLSGFKRSKIKAHPKVVEFYVNLAKRQHEEPEKISKTKQGGDKGSKSEPMLSGESDEVTTKLRFSLQEFLQSLERRRTIGR